MQAAHQPPAGIGAGLKFQAPSTEALVSFPRFNGRVGCDGDHPACAAS